MYGVINERFEHCITINNHLDVAWDTKDARVQVLVDGRPVLHCAFLVADISPVDESIESIDDLARVAGARQLEGQGIRDIMTIEEEVFAHASNIQAWAEHDYDTRLLHSNIAFPLLKELAAAGDDKATRVLQADIETRLRDGSPETRQLILKSCWDLIDPELIERILSEITNEGVKSSIWYDRANDLHERGNFEEAMRAYRESIRYKPGHVYGARFNLGITLHDAGDLNGAIEIFREVVAEHSWVEPEAWYNLGTLLDEAGDSAGAIDAYRHAIDVDRNYVLAWNNLSCCLNDIGQVDEAIEAARQSLAIDATIAMHWTTLGEALQASGDVDGAVEAYQKALSIDRAEPYARSYLDKLGMPWQDNNTT
ncbi:MAG TPA: tetratricopeptide repeat protein [Candidatus Lokiarchaeia archaeon]|nr:tetratricopeptide repeat protein [Candidatus Lokiarchaeia archaeon]